MDKNRNQIVVTHTSPGMTAPRKGVGPTVMGMARRLGRAPANVPLGKYIVFRDGSLRRVDRLPEGLRAEAAKILGKAVKQARPAAKKADVPRRSETKASTESVKHAPTLRDKFGRFLKRVVGGK